MTELLLLAAAAGVFWFWYDATRARELARNAGKTACRREGLQFLDDTVVLARLRLARNRNDQLVPRRTYRFEFSDTGDNRLHGEVTVLGGRVEALHMEAHRFPEQVFAEPTTLSCRSSLCAPQTPQSKGCGDGGCGGGQS